MADHRAFSLQLCVYASPGNAFHTQFARERGFSHHHIHRLRMEWSDILRRSFRSQVRVVVSTTYSLNEIDDRGSDSSASWSVSERRWNSPLPLARLPLPPAPRLQQLPALISLPQKADEDPT